MNKKHGVWAMLLCTGLVAARTITGVNAWTVNPATYTVGTVITANVSTPTYSGNGAVSPVLLCTASPTLPAGLTITNVIAPSGSNSSTNCTISGTPTVGSAATTYTITFATGFSNTISITVNGGIPANLTFKKNPATFSTGVAITPDSASTTGGAATKFKVTSGSLPAGLSLDTVKGIVSGTPTVTGDYTDTITASNASGSTKAALVIHVLQSPTGLTYTSPVTYSRNPITANTPTVTGVATKFKVTAGALPGGLVIDTNTGTLSGTPTVTGSFTPTITASNAGGGSTTATLSITVVGPPSNLSYSASSYKIGVGLAITTLTPTLGGSGGLPVVYSISPDLNANTGLNFNTANGAISGTPTLASVATSYTVTAANDSGSAEKIISIAVLNPISTFTFATHTLLLPRNALMTPDTATVTGADPFTPVTYSTAPALPAGLALDTNTGIVSGTPTTSQVSANYVITARNGITSFNKLDTLHITVVAPPSGLSYSSGSINVDQNASITTLTPSLSSNGNGTITYSISPDLTVNTGLSFNTATGAISGTATTISTATTYTITATNIAGFTTTTMSITVFGAEDYSQWSNFKDMRLNTQSSGANVTTGQGRFPVLIRLTNVHRAIFQQAGSGGASIRFANASGTHLPYQIERWRVVTGDTSAAIWVRADTVLGNSTTTVRMYWGNGASTSRSNGATVFTNGYVGTWHLGDTTGSNPRLNSKSPGTNDATPLSSMNPVTGVIGMADSLIGGTTSVPTATRYMTLGTLPKGTFPNATATLMMWAKPITTTASYYSQWLSVGDTSTTSGRNAISMGKSGTGANIFNGEAYNGATSNGAMNSAANVIVSGQWQLFAVSFNGTTANGEIIYKNGINIGQKTAANVIPDTIRPHSYIGRSGWAGDSLYRGVLDEVVISNIVRSADWIKLSYNTQKSGVTPVFDLSYATPTAVYGKGAVITANVPAVTGNATRWTVSPNLPAGLAINAGNGQITGTPTATSAATNYTITAFSDSCWFTTATVNFAVNGFTYSPHVATHGKNVAVAVPDSVSGVVGTFTKYSINPNLTTNTGLSLDTLTGKISGTPNKAAALTKYTITGTFVGGTAMDTVDVTINGFTYATKPATYGKNVAIANNTLTGSVGTFTGYTVSPALPSGLSMSATTGVISGTPRVASAANSYVVTGTYAGGTAKDTVSITVVGFLYAVKPAVFGKNVAVTPDMIGTSVGTFTGYTVNPALPSGLSLNTSTGAVSGTPTATAAAANYVITGTGGAVAGVKDTVNITVAGFTYVTKPATYGKNVAITNNTVTSVGSASTSYSVSPALPPGLSLNTSTGVVSGTPTIETPVADYLVTGNGGVVSGVKDTLRITVNGFTYSSRNVQYGKNIAITADTLSAGKVGTFTGFSVSPSLPAGLSVNSSGVISGTPTVASSSNPYVVTGTFTGGSAKDTVNLAILGIAYSNNPATYRVGTTISSNAPTASGWSPTSYSGTLPSGLSLDDGTGIITGTPTVAAAATKYTITATNGSVTARDTLTFTINNALPVVAYTTPVVYAKNVVITNNVPVSTGGPVSGYTISPSLPAGLSFSLSTGVISGSPTVNSTAQNYTVIATGPGGADTVTVNIAVNDAPPHITYATPVIYRVDSLATPSTPVNTGGVITHFSISPALPTGLSLDTLTGVISGTPTVTAGTLNYTVTASGSGGSGTFTISITVTNASAIIVYTDPVTYVKGVAISPNAPTKIGGPFTHYNIIPGLPSGLLLDSITGILSGTATVTAAAQGYAITATGVSDTAMDTLSITVLDTSPAISYKHPAVINIKGVAMVPDTVVSTGGAVTVYHVTPVLPTGLVLDTLTGFVSGTPTTVTSAANYTVTATGPGGTGVALVSITVGDTAPAISYVHSVIMAIKGVTIVPDTALSAGGAVTSYSVIPSLPSGLSISSTTGRISGTPAVVSIAANYTITATGPGGTGAAIVSITVGDTAPAISYKRPTVNAVKHVSMTPDTVVSAGGAVTGFVINPPLPSGLIFDTVSGRISGTPDSVTLAANYLVTATGPGGTGNASVNLSVQDTAPSISYQQTTVSAFKNIPIIADTVVVLGTGAITRYSVIPPLPAGLSLDTATGVISGTPTVLATAANYTVTATGPGGVGTQVVNISVESGLPVILYPISSVIYTKGVTIAPNGVISTGGIVTSYAVSPALPAGLSLDTLTGAVSGTPSSQSNLVSYTVTATGPGGEGTAILNIAVYAIPSDLAYNDDPTIYVLGIPITPNGVSVTGLITHFSVDPALPAGLTLDSLSGVISGIPTGTQHFAADYTVTASNPVGSTTGTVNVGIVGPPSDLSYADDVPTYAVNQVIDPPNTPTIHGIVTLFTIIPSLPPGVSLDQTTGYILGMPTAASSPTDYTITGLNPGGSASATITLGVIEVPLDLPPPEEL